MSVILAILALTAAPQTADAPSVAPASVGAPAAVPVAETETVRAARAWLQLHDEGRWRETWEGSTAEFRKQNSLESWAKVAETVRPPMGATISRTAISREQVPTPPSGAEIVKFRTRFANKGDATETIALVREGGEWKVQGIYID